MTSKKRYIFYAQGPKDLLTQAQALGLYGQNFMQGILDSALPAPTIGKTLNYKLFEVGDSHIVFRDAPLLEHCDPMGTMHGGW